MIAVYAEKPDLGRKIATALANGGKIVSGKTALRLTYKDAPVTVTWGFGHMYGLQDAKQYDEKYSRWNTENYPFFPTRYQITPRKECADHMKAVIEILKSADLIVNAADADREGELIFSYVMEGARLSGKKPVKRLWLHSYVPADIRRSFDNMKDGSEMRRLELAARARAIADWSIGINLTVYASLAYSDRSKRGDIISIGRVQTPTLAMVVNRELAIRAFESKPFWNVKGIFTAAGGIYEGQLDVEEPFYVMEKAQAVLEKVRGHDGIIESVTVEKEAVPVPKLYNLAALQKDAGKKYGFTAQKTLDIAQKLYEMEMTTYPRSDSQYLPENMKAAVTRTLAALSPVQEYSSFISGHTSEPFTKRHFDDQKVGSHYAIIPTGDISSLAKLSRDEKAVYDLIAYSLIRITYPAGQIEKSTVITAVNGFGFKTVGKRVLSLGWMTVNAVPKKEALLPRLAKGEKVAGKYELTEGKTSPPERYTDGRLISAMENAGRDIDDEEIKEQMKGCGIGTQATRADTIEKLIKRGYIKREKKILIPTEKGIDLIKRLPVEALTSPELTGQMELVLNNVETGSETAGNVIRYFNEHVAKWCDTLRPACSQSRQSAPQKTESGGAQTVPCPICGRPMRIMRDFAGCSGYNAANDPCGYTFSRTVCSKKLTDNQTAQILSRKRVKVSGMKSKKGTSFSATLYIDDKGKLCFSFDDKKS